MCEHWDTAVPFRSVMFLISICAHFAFLPLKAQIYFGMYMHQQQKRSLKYWKQKKSNARTGSSEQVRFSTPPGSWGVSWGEKKQKSVRGCEGVLTLLLQQGSTFSENKNFSDTRISSRNKIKDKSYTLFFSCMSLVWVNMCVKSRPIHMASQ
jgi:hypothetical protein